MIIIMMPNRHADVHSLAHQMNSNHSHTGRPYLFNLFSSSMPRRYSFDNIMNRAIDFIIIHSLFWFLTASMLQIIFPSFFPKASEGYSLSHRPTGEPEMASQHKGPSVRVYICWLLLLGSQVFSSNPAKPQDVASRTSQSQGNPPDGEQSMSRHGRRRFSRHRIGEDG